MLVIFGDQLSAFSGGENRTIDEQAVQNKTGFVGLVMVGKELPLAPFVLLWRDFLLYYKLSISHLKLP